MFDQRTMNEPGQPIVSAASPRAAARRPWPRRHWRRMLAGGAVLLFASALGARLWFTGRSDLAQVAAEARAQGQPTTWAELGLARSSDERVAIWQAICALAADLKPYQGHHELEPMKPVPQALRNHHAALDPDRLERLGQLLDQLGSEPLVLHTSLSVTTPPPELDTALDLCLLGQERVRLAAADRAGGEGVRLVRLALVFVGGEEPHHYVRLALARRAIDGIAERLWDMTDGRAAVADQLDALADTLLGSCRTYPAREVVYLCENDRLLDAELQRMAVSGGGGWWARAKTFADASQERFAYRAGRARALRLLLSTAADFRPLADPVAMAAAARAFRKRIVAESAAAGFGSFPVDLVGRHARDIIEDSLLEALHARVVAAELRGQPWPEDWFDPGGERLRPFPNRLIITDAYSVGMNGTDDGGLSGADERWHLYAVPEHGEAAEPGK
jgi:hypothetical protein